MRYCLFLLLVFPFTVFTPPGDSTTIQGKICLKRPEDEREAS